MASASPLIRLHRTLSPLPLGGRMFSMAYQLAAPYFLTIPATIETLAPGHASARMPKRPWLRNHLGTVHAIALCNLAEFVMGACAEATVPDGHRWIPRGMTVEYLAKARGTMHAEATLELPAQLADRQEATVDVRVADDAHTTVFTAQIRIWVTTTPSRSPE